MHVGKVLTTRTKKKELDYVFEMSDLF